MPKNIETIKLWDADEFVIVEPGSVMDQRWRDKGYRPRDEDSDPPEELTPEQLAAAVGHCFESDHPERLTNKGLPRVDAMQDFLGRDITMDQRDAGLAEYQRRQEAEATAEENLPGEK